MTTNIRLRVLPRIPPVDGSNIELGLSDTHIRWREVSAIGETGAWHDLIAISALVGPAGPELEMRVDSGFIQWRVVGEEDWNNLVALEDLRGADGSPGMIWAGSWVIEIGGETSLYTQDLVVEHLGNSYICIEDHEAGEDSEPGVGANWQDYWNLVAEKGESFNYEDLQAAIAHAEEWAQSPDPISEEAGGDGETDQSSKTWAGRSKDDADRAQTYAAMLSVDRIKFNTVAALLADTTMGYDSEADIHVGPGDIIEAQGFRYEVAPADATDAHLETAGGVKLYVRAEVHRPAMYGITSSTDVQNELINTMVSAAASQGASVEWGEIDLTVDPTLGTTNARGIVIPSGSLWIMSPDTVIRSVNTNAGSYEIFTIYNTSDIAIIGNGAQVIGDNDVNGSASGEWGHGVSIRGGNRITITDLRVDNCFGDSFYIGSTPEQAFSADVNIIRPRIDGSGRNGISVISVKGLLIDVPHISGIRSRQPMSGIDLEVNNDTEFMEGVVIRNPRITDCEDGFSIVLNRITSAPDVLVEDLDVDLCDVGINLSCSPSAPVGGSVTFKSPRIRETQNAAINSRRWGLNSPQLNLIRPQITDANLSGGASLVNSAMAFTMGGSTPSPVGNISIIEPHFEQSSGVSTPAHIQVLYGQGMDNFTIKDPLTQAIIWVNAGNSAPFRIWKISDALRATQKTLPSGGGNVELYDYGSVLFMSGLSSTTTWTVDYRFPVGTEFTFVQDSPGQIGRIRLPASPALQVLRPSGNTGALNGFDSNVAGSTITIRKTKELEWVLVNKTGTWNAV